MRILSQIVSFVFHPMLMPTLGLILILHAGTHVSYLPFDLKRLIYIIVLASSFLLPVSLLPLFLQLKVIKSFRMESARERIWPLLFSVFFFMLGYFLLARLHVPGLILEFLLASVGAVLIACFISLFWKISLHMLAVGGVMGVLVGISLRFGVDLFVPVIGVFLASGLVGTSRLFLNEHCPAQIYTGYLTGFFVVLMMVLL